MLRLTRTIKNNGLPSYLVRKKLKGNIGYGIFLRPDAKPILKGEIIAPYAGEVSLTPQNESDDDAYAFDALDNMHLTKEEQKLFDKKNRYHPRRLYALKIDGFKKGNFTRFVNHSEKPNVVADALTIPKNHFNLSPMPIEIVYIAKKTIRPGEQLLVCYEDEEKSYWSALNIKPFPMTPQTFKI
jgi:SET domain-containing protein